LPWGKQDGEGPKKPWGNDPSGGMRPPDFEELLRRAQESLSRYLPLGALGRGGLMVAVLAAVGLWVLSGFYIVHTYEQGVVLRFGSFVGHTGPGVHYHLPWPIEVAYTPEFSRQKETDIGFKPAADSTNPSQTEDIPDESLMLTGDENIVDVNFAVLWQIKDANAYLFNVERPDDAVKAVAESAMREAVGQDQMDLILTSDRGAVQRKVLKLMQQALDSYGAGIQINEVKMLKTEPPLDVRAAYLDVQSALADQDRKRSEAQAYANTIIPQARGEASHIVQDAEAYRQKAIAEAQGESARFLAVDQEYKKAPAVTRQRLWLETMSQVLAPLNKVVVDDAAKGVVPYFQLPALPKSAPPQRAPAQSSEQPSASAPEQSSDQGANQ